MAHHTRNADRDQRILRDHLSGMTLDELGAKYDLSRARCGQIVAAWREEFPPEERPAVVQREAAWLNRMRVEVMELWDADPIPAYSNGKPIELPDGRIADDHSGRLAGLRAGLDIQSRLAKLLGLDAPAKADVSVTSLEREATSAAAEAAAAFLSGDGDSGSAPTG